MEQLVTEDDQREGIDLLLRPVLDLLSVNFTGIKRKKLSKMEQFEI